jgi:hypothetical protein
LVRIISGAMGEGSSKENNRGVVRLEAGNDVEAGRRSVKEESGKMRGQGPLPLRAAWACCSTIPPMDTTWNLIRKRKLAFPQSAGCVIMYMVSSSCWRGFREGGVMRFYG